MRLRTIALTTAMVSSLAFAPAATQSASLAPGDTDPGVGSANFTLTQNVAHSSGGRGSDIEFATFTFADEAAASAAGYRNPAADADPATPGIQKDIALAGTTGVRLYLYDVTTPNDVYETAAYECPANQGDTQVFTRDGRTFTTYTVEDGSSAMPFDKQCAKDAGLKMQGGTEGSGKNYTGTFIIEITNPFAPKAVAFIPVKEGSHNGTIHPSGNYFYNSNSSLITEQAGVVVPSLGDGQPGIEYYDISDFSDIKRLGKLILPLVPASLGTESHDITFAADGTRAYSAALSQGVVIDTTNPAAPKVISNWADPTIQVWHQADPIDIGGRRFLFIEDEVAGATGTGQCPNGGVHVYEVTGDLEKTPLKVGYWNIDEARVMAAENAAGSPQTPLAPSCTAHVFRLYPESKIATISYYNGGVRVLDLGGMTGIGLGTIDPITLTVQGNGQDPIKQIGFRRFDNSNSWAAKAPRIPVVDGKVQDFNVFSNDSRGIDSLKFTSGNAAAEAYASQFGRWMTPAEAELVLPKNLSAAEAFAGLKQYSCLLK